MADPRTAALGAYWRFFEGFNSRRAESWADGLNFPHARVSPNGRPRIVESAAVHAREMSWDTVEASGWDHSVGAEPVVVHVSDDCVHVIGGWSRFTGDDRLIMTNHVGYVITRMVIDGRDHWGMQARFGIDPGPTGLSDRHAATAEAVVDSFLAGWQQRELAQCVAAAHLPCVRVTPGHIACAQTASTLIETLQPMMPPSRPAGRSRSVQCGPRAVNVAVGEDDAAALRGLVLVTEVDGIWGVRALSVIGETHEHRVE